MRRQLHRRMVRELINICWMHVGNNFNAPIKPVPYSHLRASQEIRQVCLSETGNCSTCLMGPIQASRLRNISPGSDCPHLAMRPLWLALSAGYKHRPQPDAVCPDIVRKLTRFRVSHEAKTQANTCDLQKYNLNNLMIKERA